MTEEQSARAEKANAIFERVIRPQVDVEEEAHKYVATDTEAERLRPSKSTPISGLPPIGCWSDI